MPYQLFYGNPFIPGVGQGIFEGAKNREDFARRVQNQKLLLERRGQDIQAAQIAVTQTAREVDRDLRLRELREREEYHAALAEKWKREHEQQIRQSEKQEREKWAVRERERFEKSRAESLAYREETNELRSVGGRVVERRENMPDGYYPHVDTKGYTWAVPDKQKERVDAYVSQLEAQHQWRRQHPDKAANWDRYVKDNLTNVNRALSGVAKEISERMTALGGNLAGAEVIEQDPQMQRLAGERARLKQAQQWWIDNRGKPPVDGKVPGGAFAVAATKAQDGGGEFGEDKVEELTERLNAIPAKQLPKEDSKVFPQLKQRLRQLLESGDPGKVALAEEYIERLEKTAGR